MEPIRERKTKIVLEDNHIGLFVANLKKKNILLLLENNWEIAKIAREVSFFNCDLNIIELREWNTQFYDVMAPSLELQESRIRNLRRLQSAEDFVLLATAQSLVMPNMPFSVIEKASKTITVGEDLAKEKLTQILSNNGYRENSDILTLGDFCENNYSIEFIQNYSSSFRVSFDEEKITSIRKIDLNNKTTIETLEQLDILPIREVLEEDDFQDNYHKYFHHSFTNILSREYYLPLFYKPSFLLELLPENTHIVQRGSLEEELKKMFADMQSSYGEKRKEDVDVLEPNLLYDMGVLEKLASREGSIIVKDKNDAEALPLENIPNFSQEAKLNNKPSLELFKKYLNIIRGD